MPNTTSSHILSLSDGDLSQYVRDAINSKTLSQTMETLNQGLLSTDTEARRLAKQAIERLGFVVES